MADPQFDEVNATTLREIYPKVIEDQFFKGAPFLAYLKHNVHDFAGGVHMQNPFLYRSLIGGAYAIGDTFTTTRVPSLSGTKFHPRYYYVAVPEFKETIQVINTGPLSVFNILQVDLQNAMQTINGILANSFYREGQTSARDKETNGMSEAMNDGTNPSWDGTVYTTYGFQTRNGVVGAALNSVPLWVGDSSGNPGPITYKFLAESYEDASVGEESPNLGLGNKAVIAYIRERMQIQQRFDQVQDPYYGASSFKFMNANIMKDEYAPSAVYGSNDAILGNSLTAAFTTPAGVTAASRLPASTSVTPSEVFMWLNSRTWLMRLATDSEYGFGFSGFIPSQYDTRVVGYVKAALNLQCLSPRLNKMIYGINS